MASFVLFHAASAQVSFKKTHLLTVERSKQSLVAVNLLVYDDKLVLTDHKTGADRLTVPFAGLQSMSYEMAKRHRVAEGAALMGLSMGAGAVLMFTKTKSHWIAIEYREADHKQTAVIQLHKDEYGPAIAALESKARQKIEILTEKESRVNPTIQSENLEETVTYPLDRVRPAVKTAMERYGCTIASEKADRVECKRGRSYNEATGGGGEKITARLNSEGTSTRIRIETGKGVVGRLGKKNWSTPIFNEMKKQLDAKA
jgi:hypothetical protein